MGNPLDESTDIGTIISKAQLEKVERYIALGKSEQVEQTLIFFL